MGNIDAKREWGHAKYYVRMQWMMLRQDEAEDFVIATEVQYSVREFIDRSAREPEITTREMCAEMVAENLKSARPLTAESAWAGIAGHV